MQLCRERVSEIGSVPPYVFDYLLVADPSHLSSFFSLSCLLSGWPTLKNEQACRVAFEVECFVFPCLPHVPNPVSPVVFAIIVSSGLPCIVAYHHSLYFLYRLVTPLVSLVVYLVVHLLSSFLSG